MVTQLRVGAVVTACLVLTGCAGFNQWLATATQPPGPQMVAVQIPVRTLSLNKGGAATVRKGGVMVTVSPVVPSPVRRLRLGQRTEYPAAPPGPNNYFRYQVPGIPYYDAPARLTFQIKMENQLASPVHLSGSVIALRVGGKKVDTHEYRESYEEIQNGLVLPDSSSEWQFVGPSFDAIPSPTTVEFSLYDVVTKLDQASNPIARSAFTWKFDYAASVETREEPIEMISMQQGPGNYDGPCRIDCH